MRDSNRSPRNLACRIGFSDLCTRILLALRHRAGTMPCSSGPPGAPSFACRPRLHFRSVTPAC